MTELSQEQVAEIREALPGDISYRDVLALCDTVEHLREGYEEMRSRLLAHADAQQALTEGDTHSLAAWELLDELETLRGIAQRARDGWRPVPIAGFKEGEYVRNRWHRRKPVQLRSGPDDSIEAEPMTPAEVQAIYGEKETHG